MSCHFGNFYVIAVPVTDMKCRAYAAPQGFTPEPFDHLIGEEPAIGESIIGGTAEES